MYIRATRIVGRIVILKVVPPEALPIWSINPYPTLEEQIVKLIASEKVKVILDLSEVKNLHRTDIGRIIFVIKRLRVNKGDLTLLNTTPQMKESLKERDLQSFDDEGAAAMSFSGNN